MRLIFPANKSASVWFALVEGNITVNRAIYVSGGNYNTSVMTLVHFFKFLLTTCSLIWMLNHSSFLQSKFLLCITLRARIALLLRLKVDEILDRVFWMMCNLKSSAKKPDTITRTVFAFSLRCGTRATAIMRISLSLVFPGLWSHCFATEHTVLSVETWYSISSLLRNLDFYMIQGII